LEADAVEQTGFASSLDWRGLRLQIMARRGREVGRSEEVRRSEKIEKIVSSVREREDRNMWCMCVVSREKR
jgi:hypothetical protein